VAGTGRALPVQPGRRPRDNHPRPHPARCQEQPDPRLLRTVLYRHAYNPARPAPAGSDADRIPDWARQASLPVTDLAQPQVLRAALDAITMLLDGSRAAPVTITRKHAVLHAALAYACETGLLDANPLDATTWRVPRTTTAVSSAPT
jgi:hypothetical protein